MNVLPKLDQVFGKFSRLVLAERAIDVRFWENPESSIGVTGTVGMSRRHQVVPEGQACPSKEPRIELFSYSYPENAEAFARVLLDLSRYAFTGNRCLFWWQTIPLGRELVLNSSLVAVMLTFPPYSADEVTFVVDKRRIDLVWAIPIYESELDYCELNGIDAFEALLESNDVDIADMSRRSVVGF